MTHEPHPDTRQRLPEAIVRLLAATNAHDVDEIVGCFAEDYLNATPAHPARGFTGREQVRRNWSAILAGVPDLVADVTDWATGADTFWTEWVMRGTRRDGSAHEMYGTIIFTVRGDEIAGARFHLEPVDAADLSVGEAVQQQVAGQACPVGRPS